MQIDNQQVQDMATQLVKDQEQIQRAYLEQRKHLDDNMVISGKTVKEWRDELFITIPVADLSPQICIEVNLAIKRSADIVAYELAKAQMRGQILSQRAMSAYYGSIHSTVDTSKAEGKRQPSAATLETMAEVASSTYKKIAIEADNEVKFWKTMAEHLERCKKIMEQAGYALGAEIRSEGYARYLDALGKNYGGSQ